VHEARGLRELSQRAEGVVMEAIDALDLVWYDERFLP